MFDALRALSAAASGERERLNTRELPLRSPASAALRQAAASAWESLPGPARDAVLAARTVIWMPAAAAGLDRLPFELLLHDGGWLGSTHVVARCPSFQYLEQLVAPNARSRVPPARATVAQIGAIDRLGVLDEAEADAATAMRAAQLLGLQPELRQVSSVEDARTLFAGVALVHYVGHGFASELGEWLPVSDETRGHAVRGCLAAGRGRARGVLQRLPRRPGPARRRRAPEGLGDHAARARITRRDRRTGERPGHRLPAARARDLPRRLHRAARRGAPACPRATRSRGLSPAARRRLRAPRRSRCAVVAGRALADPLARTAHALPRHPRGRASRPARRGTGRRCPGAHPRVARRRAHAVGGADRGAAAERSGRRGRAPDRAVQRARERRRRAATGYLAAAALEDSYAMAHLLVRHEALWRALDPAAYAATTEARLRMLGADRALVESPQR